MVKFAEPIRPNFFEVSHEPEKVNDRLQLKKIGAQNC